MKNLTANPVLRITFAHLEEVLHEKNRQMKKASSQTGHVAPLPISAPERTPETDNAELCREPENSDY